MSPHSLKPLVLAVVAVVSSAYTNESVAAPPQKEVGLYNLSFQFSGELVLDAHVTDNEQNPALDGVVIFDYCSFKGLPRNDISQPDEAPISACADGSGRWVRLRARVPVSNGHALLNFGVVQVVNVIGFRGRYTRGSEIADSPFGPVDWIR